MSDEQSQAAAKACKEESQLIIWADKEHCLVEGCKDQVMPNFEAC